MTEAQTPTAGGLLRVDQAAEYLSCSESWLAHQRIKGKGPRFVRMGHAIRYRRADLDAYLEGSVVETADTRRQAARSGKAAA